MGLDPEDIVIAQELNPAERKKKQLILKSLESLANRENTVLPADSFYVSIIWIHNAHCVFVSPQPSLSNDLHSLAENICNIFNRELSSFCQGKSLDDSGGFEYSYGSLTDEILINTFGVSISPEPSR